MFILSELRERFRGRFPLRAERRIKTLESTLETMLRAPTYDPEYDRPFNGQTVRRQIFDELVKACRVERIVETGTFQGSTTGYMAASTGLPLATCEVNPLFHYLSCQRLARFENISLYQANSVDFLGNDAHAPFLDLPTFFYLDAHWYKHLPLREELDSICSRWAHPIIMVDDFQVPGDPGYTFDNYGWGNKLCLTYLKREIAQHGLRPFFPNAPSAQETGARRGSVVLARDGATAQTIGNLDCLQLFSE